MPTRNRVGTGKRVIGYVITRPIRSVTSTVEKHTITLFFSRTQKPRSISTLEYAAKVGLCGTR